MLTYAMAVRTRQVSLSDKPLLISLVVPAANARASLAVAFICYACLFVRMLELAGLFVPFTSLIPRHILLVSDSDSLHNYLIN